MDRFENTQQSIPKQEADVIVVGAGGAGLSAAVTAAEHGASVLVLEMSAEPGGSTGMAIGALTVPGSPYQKRKNISDSVEAFIQDLETYAGSDIQYDNPKLREILIRELPRTLRWLEGMGISFVGPFPEPPHRVPRMHNAVPSGRVYIETLLRRASRLGVTLVCSMRARDLITENGRVTGVVATRDSQEFRFRARRGVILTTGDFSGNRELKAQFFPPDLAALQPLNPRNTGDGHVMGVRVGGALRNMHLTATYGIRFPLPPADHGLWRWERILMVPWIARLVAGATRVLPPQVMKPFLRQVLTAHMAPEVAMYQAGAILVNRDGERFTNEVTDKFADVVLAVSRQPGVGAYLVLDGELAETFSHPPNPVSTAPGVGWAYFTDYVRSRPDIVFQGETLEEVGRKAGVNGRRLAETVAAYNRAMAGEEPDPFHRPPSGRGLRRGPWYIMGPLLARQMTTKGGLSVDTNFRVLTEEGDVIPGLFAAGSTGFGGLVLVGHGLMIGWAFLSGRLAGQAAATLQN